MSVETLIKAYQELSKADRAYFLSLVLAQAEKLSPEWKGELDRRWQAFKAGDIKPLDGFEVEKKLAEKHGLQV